MGKQPPEDIIDAEILSLVRLLNSAPYIETNNCCSGYTTDDPSRRKVSDGERRRWLGKPYVQFQAIGDRESRAKCLEFVDYLISELAFHSEDEKTGPTPEGTLRKIPRWEKFKALAASIGLDEDEYDRQFPLFIVDYSRNGFTLSIMMSDGYEERTSEEVMQIWRLLELVARDFIERNP